MHIMSYRLDVRYQKKGTYLVIEEKYRDKETKKSRTKHHKTLGYVHDLQQEFPLQRSCCTNER